MVALSRGSASSRRWAAWVTATQGVLPSQVSTLRTDLPVSCSASRAGGGAKGHSAARGDGYFGSSSVRSAPVVFSAMSALLFLDSVIRRRRSTRVRHDVGGTARLALPQSTAAAPGLASEGHARL